MGTNGNVMTNFFSVKRNKVITVIVAVLLCLCGIGAVIALNSNKAHATNPQEAAPAKGEVYYGRWHCNSVHSDEKTFDITLYADGQVLTSDVNTTGTCLDGENYLHPDAGFTGMWKATVTGVNEAACTVSYDFICFPCDTEAEWHNGDHSTVTASTQRVGCSLTLTYSWGGWVEIYKSSSCNWSLSNPNYSLEGAIYKLYNSSGAEAATLTTDSNGYAKSERLPKGNYTIKEVSSSKNYILNTNTDSFTINSNATTTLNYTNANSLIETPVSDPALAWLVKADKQTGEIVEEGAASFEGAQYDFEYFTDNFTSINTETYKSDHKLTRHWVMATDENGETSISDYFKDYKVDGDDFYYRNGHIVVPVGSLVIHETLAPEGYELSDKYYIAKIYLDTTTGSATSKFYNSDGSEISIIIDPQHPNGYLAAQEQVKKGDFNFDKQDTSGKRLNRIPFKVTSTTTGESHVVVTDDAAEVNTSNDLCSHTTNTNYFDCILDESGNVRSDAEDIINKFYDVDHKGEHAGVWFCWDTEKGCYVKPGEDSESLGAMPYDTYIIEELPVSANSPYIMLKQEFTINTPNYNVDLGTLPDPPLTLITLETEATDLSGGKTLDVGEEVWLNDRVRYTGVEAGSEYTLKSWVVRCDNEKTVSGVRQTTITPSTSNGYEDVKLSLNTLSLAGVKLCCYEELYKDGVLVAQHKDATDIYQGITVKSPSCSTKLVNTLTGTKIVPKAEAVSITDSIYYNNLEEGQRYTVNTQIINKDTGIVISASTSEQLATASKTWDIQTTINTLNIEKNTKLVCYETIKQDNIVVCSHCEISDDNQTITVADASLVSFLHLKDDAAQVIPRSKSVSVVDDVDYYGLQIGGVYTITGKLYLTDGTAYVDGSGNEVSYTGNFTADATGSTTIPFSFDTSDTPDSTKIVCLIKICMGDTVICYDYDLTNTKETVTVVASTIDISTNARSYLNNNKEVFCVSDEGVIDSVSYQGAEAGYEYTLRARVIDKTTKQVYTPVNCVEGKDYVEKKFIAKTNGYGSEDVVILLDTRQIQARNLVVYEELYDHLGVLRAAHEQIDDYYQSVDTNQPKIETDLYQKSDETQVLQRYTEQHLVDKITYSNFAVLHDYVFSGVLMVKNADGTASTYINEVTGLPVTATYTFRPQEREGSFDKLEYVFDSTLLPKDTELVSYVTVTQADGALIDHCVLDDTRETVKVVTPTIKTKLYDTETGETSFIACRDKIISDDYTWTDLPKDRVMQVYSWLVNHDTGYPVTDGQITDDEALEVIEQYVTAFGGRLVMENNADYPSRWCVLFTDVANKVDTEAIQKIDVEKLSHIAFATNELAIADASGTNTLTTTFNYGITPAQKAVAMSVVVSENTVVASHTDIEDSDEAIDILRSEITTTLSDTNGNKEVASGQKVMLVDVIDYKNCIVGKEYTLSGSLVNKADESVVAANSAKFVCDATNGQTTISFEIESGNYSGWDLVAYEELYLDGDLACEHKDINDAGQTIHVNTPVEDVFNGIKTGDKTVIAIISIIALALMAGCGVYFGRKYGWFSAAYSYVGNMNIGKPKGKHIR